MAKSRTTSTPTTLPPKKKDADAPPPIAVPPSATGGKSGTYGLGAEGQKQAPGAWTLVGGKRHSDKRPLTIDEALNHFNELGRTSRTDTKAADKLAQIQRLLYLGGFYGATFTPVAGVIRPEDVTAFKKALRSAAAQKLDLHDYLSSNAEGYQALGTQQKRAPNVIGLTNPDDIRRTVDAVAPAVLGHGLSPEETEHLIGAFHALQTRSQQQEYAASDPEGAGGTVVAPPDLDTFIADEAQRLHPVEAGSKTLANLSKAFLSGIGSGGVDRVF